MENTEQFLSESGIPIKGIYTPEDVGDIDYAKDIGLAGEPPFVRGVYSSMYRGRLWTLRQLSGFDTPEDANKLFRQEYELGQTGFAVALDIPGEAGIDYDDPRVSAEVGNAGVPLTSMDDIESLFRDLPIDKVSVYMGTGFAPGCALMAMYFAMAEKRGVDTNQLRGTVCNDIYETSALYVPEKLPPVADLRCAVDMIEWCSQFTPKWHPVSFDSYNPRENGINAIQELGMLMATVIEYIEEAKRRRRLPLDQFVRRFSFMTAINNDFFEEIAKLRAARRIWYKIIRERFGIEDPRCWQFRVHVQSSGSTHTTQEPLNNIMRVAYQMLAASLGGAQSMHANSYDEGICLPTEESRLISIRTGQILQYETNVVNTTDPLGGSWYVEWLTDEIERRTWEYVQKIEVMGGMVEAINSGWVHREYRDAIIERERKVSSGESTVVGVNKFRLEKEPYKVPIFRPNPKSSQAQVEKLKRYKAGRDNDQVARALQKLEEVVRSDENILPATIEAVKVGVTAGEVTDVVRKVYGLWACPMAV